jgi:hypothetical protein
MKECDPSLWEELKVVNVSRKRKTFTLEIKEFYSGLASNKVDATSFLSKA